MKKLVTSCIAILVLTNLANTKAQSPMSAREIIDRMIEVYASCRTYSDEGEVRTEYNGRQSSSPVPYFFTAFVRSSSFRFEFSRRSPHDGLDQFIAWKDRDVEKSWWPFNPGNRDARIETMLLDIANLSGGASLTIPSLLSPELVGGSSILTSLDELKLAGEDKVDGRKTFKLEGKFKGQALKLWIDSSEFLIIKIHRKMDGAVAEATTKYKPQVNGNIPYDKLAFNPSSDRRSAQAPVLNSGPSNSPPLTSSALGRSAVEEAPRLKNFGSSLKQNPKANADRKQKRSNADEVDIVRIDTDLVLCDVLVLDKQGRTIEGLSKDDFVIKEDDKPQEVGTFSLGDAKTMRRSIVLIIDYSGSQLPYIKTSIDAAKTLVDKLNPRDRMAIVTDDVKLLVDFTGDKELLKDKLESLRTSALSGVLGRSLQYDALMATLKELFNEEDVRPIIIFQTDGDQLNRLKGGRQSNPYILQRLFSFQDLMTGAEKARATIYSIIPGIRFIGLSEDEQLKRARTDVQNRMESMIELRRLNNLPSRIPGTPSDTFLRTDAATWFQLQSALVGIANHSGGWTDFLEQPDQANDVYTRVLSDINTRYIIGYYPTNRAETASDER
jgi:VWFA-related protein